ncbi:MAG: glycosyltransferase family 2 protein [Deltaproteobacteria bacterium]|nr:glycosyltransferase family 2 protein [Deltaproteobacteria bacterium]
MEDITYSVVIPVYRSEKKLRELHARLVRTFESLDASCEFIFVEDGGSDGSWSILRTIRKEDKRAKIIRLAKNFGQHNALMCGFSFVGGRHVITLDDDLQNPPEEIPKLIKCMEANDLDVVFGVAEKRAHSFFRNIGSAVLNFLIRHNHSRGKELPSMSSFRLMKRDVVDRLLLFASPNPFISTLIFQVTDRLGGVAVDHHGRKDEKSTYSWNKLSKLFFDSLLYQSALPLRGVFYMGLLSILISFVLGLFYLIRYLSGAIDVPGWTTLVLLLLFFSGAVMLSIGIVGEYLFRIVQEVTKSPQYVIRDKEL